MSLLAKPWLKDAVVYFSRAFLFAVGSYLLMYVVYGDVRMSLCSFLVWATVVFLVFAVAYVPFLLREARQRKQIKKDDDH